MDDFDEKDLAEQNLRMSLKALNSKSKSELVAQEIIGRIQSGDFKKDTCLPSEKELSDDLGVGRSTVREAVKQLVVQNILEIRRGKGTFISNTPGMIADPFGFRFHSDKLRLGIDLCELRLMIEPVLARNAALYATDEEINKIQDAQSEVAALVVANRHHEEADIRFHSAIARCTKNSILPPLMQVITSGIPYLIKVTDRELTAQAVETHQMVLDAIKSHNAEKAFDAMRLHLEQNKTALEQKIKAR